MMNFFDKEEILESYIRSERYEAVQEATQRATKKTAITLIRNGKLSVDEILTYYPDLSPVDIEDIKKEVMQLA